MTVKSRTLYGVIFSQFFATFIEYAMKLMVFTLATRTALSSGISPQVVATLAACVFLTPMLLFSLPAGVMVDRFCKRSVILVTKGLEVCLLLVMTISLIIAPQQILFPFISLGILGISSALFNPAKGSILPEVLCSKTLGRGNGLLEIWTMIAILAGYILGPALLAADGGGGKPHLTWIGPALLTGVALVSLLLAFIIPKLEKRERSKESFLVAFRAVKQDLGLSLMLLGNLVFWVVITYFGQNVLVETKHLVSNWDHSEIWQGVPLAAYWLGIAIGSFFGGKLSVERIQKGPKIGAIFWYAGIWMLFRLIEPGFFGTLSLLVLLGLAAGFLIVPIMAIIQYRAPKTMRGSVLALNNILNILGILLGSFIAMSLG